MPPTSGIESSIEIDVPILADGAILTPYLNAIAAAGYVKIATIKYSILGVNSNYDMENVAYDGVVIVAKSGGNYTTINDAVQDVSNGTAIIVMPGTYDEVVRAWAKNVSIIGVSKKHCILLHGTGEYANPPLEAGAGYFANMTIIADKSNTVLTDESTVSKAYGVHVDTNSSAGQTLEFVNCDITSEWYPAVGAGLRPNFTLKFTNCILNGEYTTAYVSSTTSMEFLGGLFFHDSVTTLTGTEQNIVLNNTKVRCNGTNAMTVSSQSNTANTVNATFYNSMLWSAINGKGVGVIRHKVAASGTAWSGNNIYLTTDSFGNNVSELNP